MHATKALSRSPSNVCICTTTVRYIYKYTHNVDWIHENSLLVGKQRCESKSSKFFSLPPLPVSPFSFAVCVRACLVCKSARICVGACAYRCMRLNILCCAPLWCDVCV